MTFMNTSCALRSTAGCYAGSLHCGCGPPHPGAVPPLPLGLHAPVTSLSRHPGAPAQRHGGRCASRPLACMPPGSTHAGASIDGARNRNRGHAVPLCGAGEKGHCVAPAPQLLAAFPPSCWLHPTQGPLPHHDWLLWRPGGPKPWPSAPPAAATGLRTALPTTQPAIQPARTLGPPPSPALRRLGARCAMRAASCARCACARSRAACARPPTECGAVRKARNGVRCRCSTQGPQRSAVQCAMAKCSAAPAAPCHTVGRSFHSQLGWVTPCDHVGWVTPCDNIEWAAPTLRWHPRLRNQD
jgi:hypothetical protein